MTGEKCQRRSIAMGIVYQEKSEIFQIHTTNTTYMMGVYAGVHLQHLYYGRKLTDPKLRVFVSKERNTCSTAFYEAGWCGFFRNDAL